MPGIALYWRATVLHRKPPPALEPARSPEKEAKLSPAPPAPAESPTSQEPIVDRTDQPGPPAALVDKVVQEVTPATVLIKNGAPGALKPDASGFLINDDKGELTVTTNWHVAKPQTFRPGEPSAEPGKFLPTELAIVTASGQEYPVTIAKIDPAHDWHCFNSARTNRLTLNR